MSTDKDNKKRKAEKGESLEQVLSRPVCYYCDRDFDDQKVLVDHQKAKHFHCQVGNCNRRLGTAGGLKVHMQQVHKEELLEVPNAMDGRRDPSVEIFAEVGVPESFKQARTASVMQYYHKKARDHRIATGNPLPGEVPPEEAQKPKRRRMEDEKDSLKARLAAMAAQRKAAKEAEAAGLPIPTAAATPPASVTPINGTAAAAPAEVIPPPSFPAPTGAFPTFPSPGFPVNASPIPQLPAFVNGGPGAYAHPQSSSPVNYPPQPPPFINHYTPPPPMHNGVNNGYLSSSPFGGGQRPQHSLPGLPSAPLGRPPGLPQHPGHFNGHGLPAPPMSTGAKSVNAVEDEQASKAQAAAKAEEFLSSFAASQDQQAPSSSLPAVAAAVAPPQSFTPQPSTNAKQKSSSKGGEHMKLSDRVNAYEEKRARAARYIINTTSLMTTGAASDSATGPVES
ncbi:Putative Zinc finger C2H2-type [Septoria linicola]|uniref:Zinc finger C2H2-type n=1 Tax=Septoria linicola TaxID=215465 RepID=A0A9Q9AMN4_9PEZI|nr:putative Zinc finger C2H2-type [Septoria linicola]USW48913.1 Putative Zinc finger C2H2-type [Septoria linicola]